MTEIVRREVAEERMRALIGMATLDKPYESFCAYVSRLIRANRLTGKETRDIFPNGWLGAAFVPSAMAPPDLIATLRHTSPLSDPAVKLEVAPWVPFPRLSSVAPEVLRVCTACLALGYHTYAWHCDAIERCPVHDETLTDSCARCGGPLIRSAHITADGLFACPRGCVLARGLHMGLDPEPPELTRKLGEHLAWVQAVRDSIVVISGPVYIAYPPRAYGTGWMRSPPCPSAGLLLALLDALIVVHRAVPRRLEFHAVSHGKWTITVRPWHVIGSKPSEGEMEALRRTFRRGVYDTHVGLFAMAPLPKALARIRSRVITNSDGGSILVLPSYLVTNSEVAALRRLLARSDVSAATAAHYQMVFEDILQQAIERREALDAMEKPASILCLSERFDAIVRCGHRMVRVIGETHNESSAQQAWNGYRELAEIPGGFIHVAEQSGPP